MSRFRFPSPRPSPSGRGRNGTDGYRASFGAAGRVRRRRRGVKTSVGRNRLGGWSLPGECYQIETDIAQLRSRVYSPDALNCAQIARQTLRNETNRRAGARVGKGVDFVHRMPLTLNRRVAKSQRAGVACGGMSRVSGSVATLRQRLCRQRRRRKCYRKAHRRMD